MNQRTELKSDELILLDKISLYNFAIKAIENMELLQGAEIITVKESQRKYVVLDTGESFSTLHIAKTEFFDEIIKIRDNYTEEDRFNDKEGDKKLRKLAQKECDCVGDDRKNRRT